MKLLNLFVVTLSLMFSVQTLAQAKLTYTLDFIFHRVLEHKNLTYKPEIPLPKLVMESETTLKEFQDDVEPQWHIRPEAITNVFVARLNKIYLIDDDGYYSRIGRCIDDSLAHELVHYIQSKYRGWDLDDESMEWDAVYVQTWFRENYCPKK